MNRFHRRLGLEGLETRNLMAGNVLVRVNAGDLIIRGDNASNSITMVQVATGSYRITGLTHAGAATRLNGGTAPVVVSGVNDDVIANLFGGNDRLDIGLSTSNTVIPDDLTINGGTGVDTVITRRVRGDAARVILGVVTENNVDRVIARGSIFRGNALIGLGGGNDRLDLANCRVNGTLTMGLNAGNDSAIINGGSAGNVRLQCGSGDDSGHFAGVLTIAGDVFADGGDGFDTATIDPNATINVIPSNVLAVNFEVDPF